MKKIDIKNLREELEKIGASETKSTIIINNAELYNDLVSEYKKDKEGANLYIIYQLNGMIIKQIDAVEKKSGGSGDEFQEFIATHKKKN